MKQENITSECCHKNHSAKKYVHHHDGGSGAIYGIGIIGALFYFLQNATTFSAVIIGIGKAIFWPAFVIFKVLTLLQL